MPKRTVHPHVQDMYVYEDTNKWQMAWHVLYLPDGQAFGLSRWFGSGAGVAYFWESNTHLIFKAVDWDAITKH